MATLYLMLGYPGAGKTTIAGIIHELTGAVHLSSDEMRLQLFEKPAFSPEEHAALYKSLDEKTEELLRAGKDVIYDANLNRRQHRQEKYDICQKSDAKPVLVWVQTAKDLSKQRATHGERLHLVPQGETLEQMFDRIAGIIEEPGTDEPSVTVDGTNTSEADVAKAIGL